MKRITILLLHLVFISTVTAQAPYVIYYAVDELYAFASDVPQNVITNVYLSYHSEHSGLHSNFRPGLYTSVDQIHLVDNEVKGGYIFGDYGRTPTYELASYRNDEKAYQRTLVAHVKSTYTQSADIVHPGHTATIANFGSDMPQVVNFSTAFDFAGSNGSSIKLNYGIKGTFAMVAQANTYPKLISPNNAQLPYVTTQFATISVPEFYRFFPEDQIGWYQDGKEIVGSVGYNLTISREIPDLGSKNCGLHSYQPFLKNPKFKYWNVGSIQIELSPNLTLGKDFTIAQPLCTTDQMEGDMNKAVGHIFLEQSVINNTYRCTYIDNLDQQTEFTFSKVPTDKVFDPKKGPYKLKFETNFKNGNYSCEQYFYNIQITPPKPITIIDTLFHDILCHGDRPSIDLAIDGNTPAYTLGYGDSIKTLFKGQNRNIALMQGSKVYAFQLSDANGCVYEQPLGFIAKEPSKLEASFQINDARCHNGNATVRIQAKGGTPHVKQSTYRYSYMPSMSDLEEASLPIKAGQRLSMRVTDAHGCSHGFPDTLLFNPADFRISVLQKQDNICPKGHSASLLLSGASADQSYRYTYAKDGKAYGSDALFKGLGSGTLSFQAQNQYGCLKDTAVTFVEPAHISIDKISMDSVRCFGESNGAITLHASGGTGSKKLWMAQGIMGIKHPLGIRYSSLADQTYRFYAEDSLGCVDSATYHMGTRSHIKHTVTALNPACNESRDGALKVANVGGVGSYHNEWLYPQGMGSSLVQERLGQGTYVLRSVDGLGCSQTDTFELKAPPALQVQLEGHPLLCKGQHLDLDAGIVGAKYEWTGTKGFKASSKLVTLTEADTYTLKVTNSFGCIGSDTFELRASDTEFKAFFVVASNVVKGDTVVLVNYNAAVDSLTWALDPLHAQRLPALSDFRSQQVVFHALGEQEIGMIGYYKGCRDVVKRKILVIDPSERNTYDKAIGIKTSVVRSCGLFPNPNDGSFAVHFELSEANVPILLTLSSTTTGSVLKQLDNAIYPDGKVDFDEDLPEGSYVIHLRVRDEVLALRFLVAYD